jgi:hypothetical protein
MLDKIKELSPPRGSVGGKSHISSRKGNRNHESDMVTHNSRKPVINIQNNRDKNESGGGDSHEISKEQLMVSRLNPDGSKSAIAGKIPELKD